MKALTISLSVACAALGGISFVSCASTSDEGEFPFQSAGDPQFCRVRSHPGSGSADIGMCLSQGLKDELDGEKTFRQTTPIASLLAHDSDPEQETGAAHPKYLWRGVSELKVAFFNDPYRIKREVLKIANNWHTEGGANIVFRESSVDDSDIRVTFTGTGYWSYIGTRAKSYPGQPTLSLSFPSPPTDDEMLRKVQHEFGHALGLMHEHQQPNQKIAWDRDKVIKYFTGPPACWPKESVEQQILTPELASGDIAATEFDPRSIMAYGVDPRLTKDGKGIPFNLRLSALDKQFIAEQYPMPKEKAKP